MKYNFLFILICSSSFVLAQPCKLFTQTFAVADTIKRNSEELYRFRFSTGQLNALYQLPEMEKPVAAIGKLQKTLDEDFASYQQAVFFQLDEKLAAKHLEELKKECPETSFNVFEREINFYKIRFKEKK